MTSKIRYYKIEKLIYYTIHFMSLEKLLLYKLFYPFLVFPWHLPKLQEKPANI